MKRIAILAAFALIAGIGAANAGPCSGSNCARLEPPKTQMAEPCGGSNCALEATQRLASVDVAVTLWRWLRSTG